MKRRCHHRKIDRDLEQLNQNLNTIIQNQNELYCKLDKRYTPSLRLWIASTAQTSIKLGILNPKQRKDPASFFRCKSPFSFLNYS